MKASSCFLPLFFLATQLNASQNSNGFRHFSIQHKKHGPINYHISSPEFEKSKPVLLYLDGSGHYPLLMLTPKGKGSTIPFDTDSLSRMYHLVVISKPGIPFEDSVQYGGPIGIDYPEPEEYAKRLSFDWRYETALAVLNELPKKIRVANQFYGILGISEGAQVAPSVAASFKPCKALITIGGNAVNQFYDFTTNARLMAERGEIGYEDAEYIVDSLHQVYREIYAEPFSTTKRWYGHTYLRWASFCSREPLNEYLKLNIPVYVAYGSADENTILNIDLLRHAYNRLNKTNLTMKTYPGLDHFFRDKKNTDQSKGNPYKEVIKNCMNWLMNQLNGK